MKEQIISLLEAGCKVRVQMGDDSHRTVIAYMLDDDCLFFIDEHAKLIRHAYIKHILEVIPPKVIEYKVGDEVMVYREMERDGEIYGKRRGPFTIVEHEFNFGSYYVEGGDLEYGERQTVWDQPICKRFEGVQYNPLPTESNDE